MAAKCRCDSKPCAGGCPCSKAERLCGPACHMGKPWESVPCLNTEHGKKVKLLKPKDVRSALCDAGLSPIGDKNELQKRLAIHYSKLTAKSESSNTDTGDTDNTSSIANSNEDLMNVILANEGDYVFILSLSGKIVKASSSKAELRKSYLLLSTKIHPDKNQGSTESKKAFQAVLESFERLANPEKFEEEEDDDSKPAKKRQKTERFTRGNTGCFHTIIRCPRCKDKWSPRDLGLEDAAYNFFMQGIKQYICGGCFAKFGCMTALHQCPYCRKAYEYDPDDYHRKITCTNAKCDKEFGFWMYKVSEKREKEIRREVKDENEVLAKKRAQMRRRAERADKRVTTLSNEDRVKEQLFLLKLLDNCPRCGWELERGMNSEDAKDHLDNCNNKEEIASYKKKLEKLKAASESKQQQEELQEDVQAFKTWEHNGRQVGQLWMLSMNILKRECKKFNLDTDGNKVELITRLGRVIRDRERKMLTMGPDHEKMLTHDITPIHKVDEEDLPKNLEMMEREELACVAASYGIDFDQSKDVKVDLVTKLERARNTGNGLLMIMDESEDQKRKRKRQEKDPDFDASEI